MRQGRAETLNGTSDKAADPSCECSWAAGCSCRQEALKLLAEEQGLEGGLIRRTDDRLPQPSPLRQRPSQLIACLLVSSRRSRTR